MRSSRTIKRIRSVTASKNAMIREREAELVINALATLKKGERPFGLEVGSGDGVQSDILSRSYQIVSVDVVRRRPSYEVPFVLGSFEALPFREEIFHLVYSSNVLEHVRDKEGSLREGIRVLAEGGELVTVVPTAFWKILEMIIWPGRWVFEVLTPLVFGKVPQHAFSPSILIHGTYPSNSIEYRAYAVDSWVRLHRQAGLREIRVRRIIGYFPLEIPLPFEALVRNVSSVSVAIIGHRE